MIHNTWGYKMLHFPFYFKEHFAVWCSFKARVGNPGKARKSRLWKYATDDFSLTRLLTSVFSCVFLWMHVQGEEGQAGQSVTDRFTSQSVHLVVSMDQCVYSPAKGHRGQLLFRRFYLKTINWVFNNPSLYNVATYCCKTYDKIC